MDIDFTWREKNVCVSLLEAVNRIKRFVGFKVYEGLERGFDGGV